MFSIYGVIIVGMCIIGMIILLVLSRFLFSYIELNKNGAKFTKDRRCEDRPCDVTKIMNILLQSRDNLAKFMIIPYQTLEKQKQYAEDRLEEIRLKVVSIFKEAVDLTKLEVSPRAEDSFRITLDRIITEMLKTFLKDLRVYEYPKMDENNYMLTKREIIGKIPDMIKGCIPYSHILKHKLFTYFMDMFNNRFAKDFVPLIENMMDYARKYEKDAAMERAILDTDLENLIKHYTEGKKNV